MSESFLNGKVTLLRGDCLELLPTLEADSIDSCVTDPPYHLTSIVKRFGKSNLERDPDTLAGPIGRQSQNPYGRVSKGFMGKQWDGGDIAFRPELWAEVWRVLKPGAHLLAFGGTRTYHRLACAIEDGGFEVRDAIMWHYGSGFPKSHDISKAIDRMAGAEREVLYVDPANARKDGRHGNSLGVQSGQTGEITAPATDSAIQWQGWGTALKPSTEIIVLARKPLSESSIASNVLRHGTGALNIDATRIGTGEDKTDGGCAGTNRLHDGGISNRAAVDFTKGRWPANLIHDGSEEVLAGFPESDHARGNTSPTKRSTAIWESCNESFGEINGGDSGSAARFFYTAKADADDRLGSKHPTVKPLDLIQYLARLITPRGGTVLDPFGGTGTCAEAAFREGFRCILIEREPEYQADIVKRMGLCLAGPDERRAASVKQLPPDDLPMFGGLV